MQTAYSYALGVMYAAQELALGEPDISPGHGVREKQSG